MMVEDEQKSLVPQNTNDKEKDKNIENKKELEKEQITQAN